MRSHNIPNMTIDKFGHKLNISVTTPSVYRVCISSQGIIDPAVDATLFYFSRRTSNWPIHFSGVVENIFIDPKDVMIYVLRERKTYAFAPKDFLGAKLNLGDKIYFRLKNKKDTDKLLFIITLKCTRE